MVEFSIKKAHTQLSFIHLHWWKSMQYFYLKINLHQKFPEHFLKLMSLWQLGNLKISVTKSVPQYGNTVDYQELCLIQKVIKLTQIKFYALKKYIASITKHKKILFFNIFTKISFCICQKNYLFHFLPGKKALCKFRINEGHTM